MPKPVQKPRPELMIGGGGEKVTLKIVARWADHWNVWGGPETLAKKGKILDGYCAEIGRDPKTILRSAVMVPLLSEDRAEIDKMQQIFMKRMGRDEASAKDTLLVGGAAQMQDKLGKLSAAGVGLLFIPTMFLGKDQLKPLDAFIEKVAPALRK
jgi:alkanesulfonate monooxygenase SsuD/methylene tetrahydromethanopterin reductase-like flavin-dependent oxidoreductase (luciferase family)